MTTREDNEAALSGAIRRVQLHLDWLARKQENCSPYWDDYCERLDHRKRLQDCARITNAFLAERAERQRRIEAAAAEIYKMPFVFEEPRDIAAIIARCLDGETT